MLVLYLFYRITMSNDVVNMDIAPEIEYFNDIWAHANRCSSDDLNILYINMRSIINKWAEFESYVQYLPIQLNIIVIVETWLRECETESYNLNNYNAFHCTRPNLTTRTRGGGTSIFVRKDLQASPVEAVTLDDSTILIIKLVKLNVHVIGVYRPNQTNCTVFIDSYNCLLAKYRRSICIGDYNLNMRNEEDADVMRYADTMLCNGFVLLNPMDGTSGTRNNNIIDHVSTDILESKYLLSITDFSCSDHNKIIITMKKQTTEQRMDDQTIQIINYDAITNSSCWSEISNMTTFDELSPCLEQVVRENRKTIVKRANRRTCKPWITQIILELIDLREFYFSYHRRFPENAAVRDAYQYYRHAAKSEVKRSKKTYFDGKLSASVVCPKKLWNGIKELMYNKPSTRPPPNIAIHQDNRQLTEPDDVCEAFNDYFFRTSHDLYQPNAISENYIERIKFRVPHSIRLRNVTEDDIMRSIDNLKSAAATGSDGVSAKFLKKYKDRLSPVITKCVNHSILNGIYPDILKCSSIVPILKAGDPTNCCNYRPISVLCSLNMILEDVIKIWITTLLDANNIIHPHQFGFTKNSNTEAAVLHMTHFIGRSIQDGFYTAVLFLDLKKAFDSIDHRILIRKLEKLGLTTIELNLLKSYLHNRRQLVKIGTHTSSLKNALSIAVPQGSKLGPVLFNFGINDIHDLVLNGEIQQFADDTSIKYKAATLEQLNRDMSHDIKVINEWMKDNHLYINKLKTKYIIFSKSNVGAARIDESNFNLYWEDQKIDRVRDINYLGIVIDHKLCWDKQVSKVKSEIAPYIFALRKIRPYATKETTTLVYNAYIVSKLVYVSPAWRTATQQNLQKLRVLQHSALKTINRLPWHTPSQSLFSARFLSINDLFSHRLILYIHKVVNNEIRHSYDLRTAADIHHHDTRNSNNYRVGRRGGRAEEANVLLHGLHIYNQLPDVLKCLPTASFKKQLRIHLST